MSQRSNIAGHVSRLARILFWPCFVFALVMASLPKPPETPLGGLGDKVQHMLAFAVLTALGKIGWARISWLRLAIGLSLFGVAIEVIQAVPSLHRDSDWRDWVADTIAIALTLAVVGLAGRLWQARQP